MHPQEIESLGRTRPDTSRLSLFHGSHFDSLQCKAKGAAPKDAISALSLQSSWPGGLKLVAPWPSARVDLPRLENTAACLNWIERQLHQSVYALHVIAGHRTSPPPARAAADAAPLAMVCSDAGWDATVNSDGTCRIELPLRSAPRTVLLTPMGSVTRVSVALARDALAAADEVRLAAAAHFLLQASGALNWARAYLHHDGPRISDAGFECLLAAPFPAAALACAIDALVNALEWYACETEMLLSHAEAAALYLEYRCPGNGAVASPPYTDRTPSHNRFHPA